MSNTEFGQTMLQMYPMIRKLEGHEESIKLIMYGCSAHLMYFLAKDFTVPEIKSNVAETVKYLRDSHFAPWVEPS